MSPQHVAGTALIGEVSIKRRGSGSMRHPSLCATDKQPGNTITFLNCKFMSINEGEWGLELHRGIGDDWPMFPNTCTAPGAPRGGLCV